MFKIFSDHFQHYELPEENVIHLIYTMTGKRLGTDYEYKYKEIKEKVKKAKGIK